MQHATAHRPRALARTSRAATGNPAASDLEQAIRFEKNHHFRFHLRALLFLAPRFKTQQPFLQLRFSPLIPR
jgi:hypothetical protein